ncbi:MAG TPA: response regulator, partial [Caulobacteraceae bacterium]|nr:response regulator [Caulobacteraceae bacterium]
MIVEDDIHLLSALTFALEAEGFAVAPFARGDEALQAPFRADCIVIDFKLPDRDGLTLIEALRSRGVSCPAILITSNPDER